MKPQDRRAAMTLALAAAAALGQPGPAAAAPATAGAIPGGFRHQTAPTRFVAVGDARLAYRRFGKAGGPPLVFLQHFGGNMDNWDPQIVDGLARDREVILFDNAGVAGSGGEVAASIEEAARYALGLIGALGVTRADLFGFSMGSFVAQQAAWARPDLVRRLVLVGSAPRGGVGMAALTPEFQAALAKPRAAPDELLLDVFFTSSPASQAAGRAFLTRLRARTVNRDLEPNAKVAPAQVAAIAGWGAPGAGAADYLKALRQPVLIVDGSHDIVFYTVNAFDLQQQLPNAQLVIYPDSGHGPQYQYPDRFLSDVSLFLARQD